jgi:hypothetical protein
MFIATFISGGGGGTEYLRILVSIHGDMGPALEISHLSFSYSPNKRILGRFAIFLQCINWCNIFHSVQYTCPNNNTLIVYLRGFTSAIGVQAVAW